MNGFTSVTIERPSLDGLGNERWRFSVIDAMVVLDEYAQESRPSKRHKFRSEATYIRLQGSTYKQLEEHQVPIPPGLFDEALEAVRSQLVVGLWKRDFKR